MQNFYCHRNECQHAEYGKSANAVLVAVAEYLGHEGRSHQSHDCTECTRILKKLHLVISENVVK
jgi:hypothetical protein